MHIDNIKIDIPLYNQVDKEPPTLHEFNNYCEIAEHHCKIQNSPSFRVLKAEQCNQIYEEFNPEKEVTYRYPDTGRVDNAYREVLK